MREAAETLYERVRALPPEARSAFLAAACADDPRLEAELRSLLAHAEPAEAFFAELADTIVTPSLGQPVGHYRLLGVLGSGGMGTVYRAHDTRLDRDVALKFLPVHLSAVAEARDRLLLEARAAAALEHPNVCSIHEIGETADGRPFIAMACYDGETLKERLERGATSVEDAVFIATQVARGLAAAHGRGIVHRDVKPGNVMLCGDGTVRLLDFGLAKLAGMALTGPGVTPGTVAYMSPEQARGGVVDVRTDLWSVGVVLYEMLAGERPFRGGNDRAVIQAILHERPEPLRNRRPGTPPWLIGVVERLLVKSPEHRYASADMLARDLTSTRSPDRMARLRGRTPAWWLAASGAFTVLAAAAALFLAGRHEVSDRSPAATTQSAPLPARAPASAVAVLPFSVRGQELELWREGMVDLLSMGLDGTGGLRAIHSRTVLARWSEEVRDGRLPDLARALHVARGTGARYALIGSAVAAGPRIRLAADIHDLAEGQLLGQAQVDGSPDSILALVDRLGMQTVGVILERHPGEIAPIELAGLTTPSLRALKAYLQGEARFRRSEFRRASEAWERAARADTMFALAYLGLAEAYGWDENKDFDLAQEAMDHAYRLADRLPRRMAAVVRARRAARIGSAEGIRGIEDAVREYPDDAGLWYALGETYIHNPRALRAPGDIARAFRQAAELQPATAPYRAHLLELAFVWRPDSARIAREVDTYERLAPRSVRARGGRLALELAFGGPEAGARVRKALDTVDVGSAFQAFMLLNHPRFTVESETVYRAIESRLDPGSRTLGSLLRFMKLGLYEGRVREALAIAEDPGAHNLVRSCGSFHLAARGLPVPDRLLEERLALSRADSSLLSDPAWVACAAAHAAERGRWGDHATLRSRAGELRAAKLAAGDSVGAEEWGGALRRAEAQGLWRQGRKVEALRAFEDVLTARAGGWWALSSLAQLTLEVGRLEQAERAYRALWSWGGAPARFHLARVLERTGRSEEAREAYEEFVYAWRNADPELAAWVNEARQAIRRLSSNAEVAGAPRTR